MVQVIAQSAQRQSSAAGESNKSAAEGSASPQIACLLQRTLDGGRPDLIRLGHGSSAGEILDDLIKAANHVGTAVLLGTATEPEGVEPR
jgi:hypothetical protein